MAAYKDEQRGTWYVSFHYYDWTGKNCRKVKRGFKTKREATEWERHFRMKEAADLDMTFDEFVQAYTRDMKPKLKQNTWLTKEHILRTKLLPYFKDKKMRDIRPKDIIQWQNEQISYRDEKGKPYAPTYLKTLQSELSALFNHAVRFYELKSNPVVKAGPLGKGKAEEMLFWTKEEYLKFIEAVKDNPLAYIRNEADILKFVDALISNTKGEGKEGDPFWTKSETLLYCALIAYIIFEGPAEDRNMNTLVDMISGMEVKEDDEDFMNAVDYMFAGLEKRKPDCFAVKQYKKYKLASGDICSK